jgi:holo-[acyl-carrier protein] synthase
MIIGIGTDMVSIQRIHKVWRQFPQAFPSRLLTLAEAEGYKETMEGNKNPEQRGAALLAKRFAAKEACLKALGTGMIQGISWHDMEITHLKSGQPVMALRGGCLKALHEKIFPEKNYEIHLSLSDEKEMALAFVVITQST